MPNGRNRGVRALAAGAAAFAAGVLTAAGASADVTSVSDLSGLSIEQLGNLEITSVSKTAQPLSDAAAAVYVITHEDIVRSGATSLAEILRMAPNLQVAQMSANSYAITARGFNGNAADKLLVLIDGRSVYTPLFGGVLWDEKDVLPENIERVEVISGPGATLWGANAVNGVINIITRKAAETQGGLLDLGYGNRDARASLQYGGTLSDTLAYRTYLEAFSIPHSKTSTGANAEDGWSKGQGGFRLDWTPQNDKITFEGDLYDGREDATATLDTHISGGNFQVNWQHALEDGSQLQLLAYYDGTRRFAGTAGGYSLNTYDIELQHSFMLGESNNIVWGAGYRLYQDDFTFTGNVKYLPPTRSENLTDIFVQDSIALDPTLDLIVGLKLEDDPFAGIKPMPNIRLSWKPLNNVLLWAAASHAVRAPTRFDEDLQDTIVPGVLILQGNRDFDAETLRAYEAGTRVQLSDSASFSISTYYNQYDDLRTVEVVQSAVLPIIWTWGNMIEGHTYGAEVWGNYDLTDWWQLKAGFNLLHEQLRFKPGASTLGGLAGLGDDPNHQASLQSTMNLGSDVKWDADLRWIGRLPSPKVPSYAELNTRIAWNVTDTLELALSGFNLLQPHHIEYELAGATTGTEIYRSVFVETKLRF